MKTYITVKSRGRDVACFLCDQVQFDLVCPLKEELGDLEEVQVQPTLVVKLEVLGEIQRHISKEKITKKTLLFYDYREVLALNFVLTFV